MKMKKFNQYVTETAPSSQAGMTSTTINQTGLTDPYNIQDAAVLKRVNAFVGSIADREYLIPENAVKQLQEFMERIGLTFELSLSLIHI